MKPGKSTPNVLFLAIVMISFLVIASWKFLFPTNAANPNFTVGAFFDNSSAKTK